MNKKRKILYLFLCQFFYTFFAIFKKIDSYFRQLPISTKTKMSVNTGNIKAENKKISDDFINLVMDMFGVIDEVSDKIGDGKYLELANQFKKLSEFKEKMGTNVVFLEHEKRTQMRVLKEKERRLTYAEKLKMPKKYYKCHKCDCVLTRKEKNSHEKTQKCKKAYSSRMITLAKKTKINSETLILLDDMLDTRRPYYMIDCDDKIKKEKRKIFTMMDYYMGNADKSAVMIQSLWRGYVVRRDYVCLGENCDMTNDDYATTIQSVWRGYNVRKSVKVYRKLIEAKTKKDFNNHRKNICDSFNIKIKGVSKMSRREIEMEIARNLWK